MLCNDVQQEGVKPSPDLASRLFCYAPLHNIWYGIQQFSFVHELTHLLDAIVNNKEIAPYGATFEDGYKNTVICDAILQSEQTGQRVKIAY